MHAVILSNRKDRYLPAALASIREHVVGVSRMTVVDDSGDPDWRRAIAFELADEAEVVAVAADPAGYTVAMQTVLDTATGEHALLWEEDFLATETIDVAEMAALLDERPYLAQVALMRQPWYANEVAAGGVLQAKGREGHEVELVDGVFEHRAFFTCNPAVWPRRTLDRRWPQQAWSEAAFGQQLLRDASVRFGMVPGVKVLHVGAERAESSHGY